MNLINTKLDILESLKYLKLCYCCHVFCELAIHTRLLQNFFRYPCSVFGRKIFSEILSYLHLTNNEKCPGSNYNNYKLDILGNISERLNQKFKSRFKPDQTLASDNQMTDMES